MAEADITREIEARLGRQLPGLVVAGLSSLMLGIFLVWSVLTRVEVVVSAGGIAKPRGGSEVLRAATATRVSRVLVSEGDEVEQDGAILLFRQDESEVEVTAAQKSLRAMQVEKHKLEVELAVLLGVKQHDEVEDPDVRERLLQVKNKLESMQWEIQSLKSKLRGYGNAVSTLKRVYKSKAQHFRRLRAMFAGRAISKSHLEEAELALLRQKMELDDAISAISVSSTGIRSLSSTKEEFRRSHLNRLRREIDDLSVNMAQQQTIISGAELRRQETVLRAPRRGIMDRIKVGRGEYVDQGQEIAVLIPSGEPVYFETKIPSGDIAFIKPGMQCRIKLDALPFMRYGALTCRVESITRGAVEPEESRPYYLARIKPSSETLLANGRSFDVIPGTTGVVDIIVSERTIFSYFTDPLRRFAATAMTEL